MLHRETSNWNHRLNDYTFLDSFIDPQTRPSRKQSGGWLQSPAVGVWFSSPGNRPPCAFPLVFSAAHGAQPTDERPQLLKEQRESHLRGWRQRWWWQVTGNKRSVDAAAALDLVLGAPQQSKVLSGMAGLGMVQKAPLGSLFGSMC